MMQFKLILTLFFLYSDCSIYHETVLRDINVHSTAIRVAFAARVISSASVQNFKYRYIVEEEFSANLAYLFAKEKNRDDFLEYSEVTDCQK